MSCFEIAKLKLMYALDLRGNQLASVPVSIGNLESLEDLILESNQLSTLPTSIINLKSLRTLDLQYNNFKTLPTFLWRCKKLKSLPLFENPWEGEWEGIEKYTTISVLELCRQRAPINLYINYSKTDKSEYRVIDLMKNLEENQEILKVYDYSNDNKILESQLMLFIATKNSISDKQCQKDLGLALLHDIGIIPIKGNDLGWNDLSQIDLRSENYGIFNLSDKLGYEFDSNAENVKEFYSQIYEYLKRYKRNYNLFDSEERKLDIQKENIKNIIITLTKSEKFRENLKGNLKKFKELLNQLETEQISIAEFYYHCSQILSGEI